MAGSAGLPLAGVEAIVEGLSAFESDTRKMNSALDSIRPRSTLLMRSFESLTTGIVNFGKGLISGGVNALASFGKSLIHIAEVALGVLFRDAINAAIGWVKDFIQSTIDAGSELQLLQLRLDRLNFNELKKSGQEYTDITAKSIEMTKEQMKWLIKLAAQTPYNNTDIANVYTLARSYGFAADEADDLTQDIVDFASGMGLTEEHIKRIIINFGQMKQQGKITGMELRDLARGAFVPVNDILARVAESLGLTSEQLDKLRKKGATDAEDFIMAFAQMVDEDFEGAAANMRRALVPAIENIQETFRSLMSWNIVKPIMDSLGGKISDVTDEIVNNETMWNRLTTATERIGTVAVGIMEDLLGLAPDAATIADKLVGGVEKLATWIEEHRDDVVGFFKDKLLPAIQGVFTWIDENGPGVMQFFRDLGSVVGGIASTIKNTFSSGGKEPTKARPGEQRAEAGFESGGIIGAAQKIAEFINTTIIPALDKFFKWVDENGPLIQDFFAALGEIASTVFGNLVEWLGGDVKEGGILDAITAFMKVVVENKDKIAEWVEIILKAIIVWQIIATTWTIVIGIIIKLVGFILGLVAVFGALNAVVAFLGPIVAGVLPFILGFIAVVLSVIATIKLWKMWLAEMGAAWTEIVDELKAGADRWLKNFKDTIANIKLAFKNGDWWGVGKAIVEGVARGVSNTVGTLVSAAKRAAQAAYNAALDALGAHSPSKLFMNVGEFTMEGFALGIERAAGLAVGAMQNAVGQVAMPAMASMAAARAGGDTITNTRSANLTINSSANTESVIQDFNMLESLMGA